MSLPEHPPAHATKPHEKINSDDYCSLFDFEEDDE